ncbi:MAG TPA: acyltransferase [Burkholderiaceae bacterium]|jgi:peptidoglycan/LPS O-acetylase OafA/YrhL
MLAYLPRLQMLRFAAAGMVLFGHAQHQVREVPGMDLSNFQQLGNAAFYASGVDVFFVLSGFIMYAIASEQFGRPQAPSDFMLRRLARIVPPYWAFTSLMLAATVLFANHVNNKQLSLDLVMGSYFFIPTPNAHGDLYPVLILGWTLNFEMLFYTIFAIGLRWPRARGLALIAGVVSFLGLGGLLFEPRSPQLAFWFNPIVFEFLFGIGLARVHASGWRGSNTWGVAMLALGIALLLLGSPYSGASPFWAPRAFWMGLPALIICAAAVLTRETKSFGPISDLLAFAGDTSYLLYLSHPFTLAVMVSLARRTALTDPWTFVVMGCLACVGAAALLHRFVEKPTLARINWRIRFVLVTRARRMPVMVQAERRAA